jgi:hypothetical protein
MEELGTNSFGEEMPICSNDEEFCGQCGVVITEENDSGWEHFVGDGCKTQKTCKECDKFLSAGGLKASL